MRISDVMPEINNVKFDETFEWPCMKGLAPEKRAAAWLGVYDRFYGISKARRQTEAMLKLLIEDPAATDAQFDAARKTD